MSTLKNMSKIDLHCHLDGSIAVDVTKELLHQIGKEYEISELRDLLQVPDDCVSLAEYLKRFDLPIQCIQTANGLKKSAYHLAKDAAEENVKYIEVRFAPFFSTSEGLSIPEIIENVQAGLKQAEQEFDIRTGIIVCAMRHLDLENNVNMLRQSRELFGHGVVACDLAGDENAFPTAMFRELFHEAKRLELPYTIHSGECGSCENIKEAIDLGAKRLGHGIAMAHNKELIDLCAKNHIGVELCPTSNFQTKAVCTWEEYPLLTYLNSGVPISVNTDNRTVSATNSTREFESVVHQFDLQEKDLQQIYQSSVEMSFADDNCKDWLLKKWRM